jgi:biopolymer transport protein ExbD
MIMSRRAKRMERHHNRAGRTTGINLVSLMDIFTILVFFLLVNSSDGEVLPTHKAVNLPESVSEEKPRETLVVMITGTDILIHGKIIGSIEAVLGEDGDTSALLKTALEVQSARALRKTVNGEPVKREATIMGDREIPYRLLKKVMATCTQAGYTRISLAVLQKPLQQG